MAVELPAPAPILSSVWLDAIVCADCLNVLPGMPDKPAGAGNEPKEQALPGGAPAPQK